MEHGLKYIVFYVQKHITLHSCHNFPVCTRQAARGTRICETGLLHSMDNNVGINITYVNSDWKDNELALCVCADRVFHISGVNGK